VARLPRVEIRYPSPGVESALEFLSRNGRVISSFDMGLLPARLSPHFEFLLKARLIPTYVRLPVVLVSPVRLSEKPLDIARTMQDPQNPDAVFEWAVEDEISLEAPDGPHSD
jgi:hypothetical protein